MKKILLIALLGMNVSFAQEIEIPKLLRDSSITTTLKNGKQFTFDGNEYMVVRRKAKKKPVEELASSDKKAEQSLASPQKLNRVRLMGGLAPNGFNSKTHGSTVDVSSTNGPVGGVGYDRMINKTLSLGGQVLSNGTYTLGLGLDF